jgi:hypothetical protein
MCIRSGDHTREESSGCRQHSRTELRAEVRLERALRPDVLHVRAILEHALLSLEALVLLAVHVCEAPLLGNDNLLAARELVARTAERLRYDRGIVVLRTDGEDDLANVHARDGAVRLAPRATHAGLETAGDVRRQ